MKYRIQYNVCRANLGEVTSAQFAAYKMAVSEAAHQAFPDAEITVGNSTFANASTCQISTHGPMGDEDAIISREDVEEVVSRIDESWWDA